MATIKDVAQRAQVSIATVSNYLNNTRPVSRAASARIKEAIEELQYTQNLPAKSLKSSVYNDVGIILPNFNDSYYVQIYQGIESAFQNSGYYLNLAFTSDIPEVEQHVVHNMLRKQVCGLILVTCQPEAWKFYYENFTRHNRPLVLLDRRIKSLDASFLAFDNQKTICGMTRHLLQTGLRNIYLMCGFERYTCESDCIRGFYEAYQQEYLQEPDTKSVIQMELNKEAAFRRTSALLRKTRPDAIVTTSELLATGVMESIRLLGYSRDEIPVVTLGEEHWNRYTHSFAGLSAARPAIKMGEQAAQLLIEKLKSPQLQESEQLILANNLPVPATPPAVVPAARPGSRIRILMLDTPAVHTFCSLLRNFENKTGIGVELTVRPHHNLYQTITSTHDLPETEDLYDVYMYDIPWLSMLASQGILADLSDRLETIDTSIFLPDCLQYFSQFQGRYYGMPFMYAPQILYYRKDLFENRILRNSFEKLYGSSLRPPRTFKEFNAVAEFFTNRTDAIDYGISFPAAYDECLAPEIYMRLRACGSEVIDAAGNAVIDNPDALRAYIALVRATRVAKPNFLSATDVSIVDDFLQGETAMLITYPAFFTNVSDLRKGSIVGSIGCSQIPGCRPLLGGWSLGINDRSRKKDEAFAFLRWTCSEKMGNYFALLGGHSVVTSTYTNDELVKLYPWLPLYHEAYQYTKPMVPHIFRRGRIVSPNAVDAIVCKWAYQLLREDCEIEPILKATQAELEALLRS